MPKKSRQPNGNSGVRSTSGLRHKRGGSHGLNSSMEGTNLLSCKSNRKLFKATSQSKQFTVKDIETRVKPGNKQPVYKRSQTPTTFTNKPFSNNIAALKTNPKQNEASNDYLIQVSKPKFNRNISNNIDICPDPTS